MSKTSSLKKKKKVKVKASHTLRTRLALFDYHLISRLYMEGTLSTQKNKHHDQKINKRAKI